MSEIRALETRYRGHFFRSRLEARWAVFFDQLGIPWVYEAAGYDVPSGRYLPDFRIWNSTWFEVKADGVPDDPRWAELATATGDSVIVARGMPKPESKRLAVYPFSSGEWETAVLLEPGGYLDIFFEGDSADTSWEFCTCPVCEALGVQFEGRGARNCGERCCPGDDRNHTGSSPKILAAFTRALSERFGT